MAFTNLGFEEAGTDPGEAAGWTYTFQAQVQLIAPIDPDPQRPVEDFERDWDVDDYLFAFDEDDDLDQALYDVAIPGPGEFGEDFEEGWSGNHAFYFSLLNLASAAYDTGTPEGVDDFEEQWSTNESFVTAFTGPELEAALYDAGAPEGIEDFEEEWRANETFLSAFTGGTLLDAVYSDSSEVTFGLVEGFEDVAVDDQFEVIPSTDRIFAVAHGVPNGAQITMRPRVTDSVLPSGLSPGVPYFVMNVTANDFQVSRIPGGGLGDVVNITDEGFGAFFWTRNRAAYWTRALEGI